MPPSRHLRRQDANAKEHFSVQPHPPDRTAPGRAAGHGAGRDAARLRRHVVLLGGPGASRAGRVGHARRPRAVPSRPPSQRSPSQAVLGVPPGSDPRRPRYLLHRRQDHRHGGRCVPDHAPADLHRNLRRRYRGHGPGHYGGPLPRQVAGPGHPRYLHRLPGHPVLLARPAAHSVVLRHPGGNGDLPRAGVRVGSLQRGSGNVPQSDLPAGTGHRGAQRRLAHPCGAYRHG